MPIVKKPSAAALLAMPNLKKPTAAALKKRPASALAVKPGCVLTEAALFALNDSADDKIEAFINKLSSNEQQSLWEKYEKQTLIDGTDQQYREGTSGAGKREKSKDSLVAFVKGGAAQKPKSFAIS